MSAPSVVALVLACAAVGPISIRLVLWLETRKQREQERRFPIPPK